MSKFKVGDKVALSNSQNVLLGQVKCEAFGGYYIEMEENYTQCHGGRGGFYAV